MEFGYLLLNLILITGYYGLPVEDDSSVIVIDETENSIDDGDVIDLTGLEPNAFGYPKDESGEAVANWTESSLMNPEEMGGYAEGDILIPQYTRNGVRDQASLWPKGIIPYDIDRRFNQEQRDTIMRAIADYHRLTCLRFVPYKDQADYIAIKSANTGCWSSVGRLGGRQEVNLQAPGCMSKKGTVLHELLHAVGFMHEQSRPERDNFVKIHYNNIKTGAENNFKKADPKRSNDYGISYDYNSVMHYSEYAFSKNSQKTIEPKVSGVTLGQREGLSRGDVKKINNMYNCK
ncbi:zinc metalloproteinase nas-7-like, partial [Vanessa atalanta]|uniref:zinc metalloproteinase nas-7-like n=1 Tax=Vanessa atalanta TaxID=42275 RepID=UPI001FCD101E